MKRTLALILAVVMVATLALAGCGNGSNNSSAAGNDDAKTAATVDKDGSKTFTVGFDAEFPPYGYKDKKSGEYEGFDLDLAAEVCKRLGWKLVKKPIDWDSKDMELNSGTINCIWNGFTINGREKEYTWSVPYIDNKQVVVVKKNSPVKSLDDLKGKTVAVQTDSSALAAFTGEDATKENKKLAASFKDLKQIPDYNTALMNLESGAVDAVGMDNGVANYNLAKSPEKYRVLEDIISKEQYGIGFKKGNTELKNIVEKTLLEMYKDGTVDKIAKNYSKYYLKESLCLKK